MKEQLLEQLQGLPPHWAFVAVDGNKRPYMPAWQEHPLTPQQLTAEIQAGRAKAIGVQAGPASGGLLFLDHDGISATAELERLGIPVRSLPITQTVTSGRDGRFQLLFHVPKQYWPALSNRRVFRTGKLDSDGKAEQVELRWASHQSVVAGHHPITGAYRWLNGRSPSDLPIAEAPLPLIELLLKPEPTPQLRQQPAPPPSSTADALPLLDFISRDSRNLIESGGAPGAWNDDQLALSLDLIGTEAWIRAQGHNPDLTAEDAFQLHISAACALDSSFSESKAWRRFSGAHKHNPHPSTPEDKLHSRLAFHTRAPRAPAPSPRQRTAANEPPERPAEKPQKLEERELLSLLRSQARDGQAIRWNTFHQQVELNGEPARGIERFYLTLADQGYKVRKDLAVDCLIQVAHEHPYDPVCLYLNHCADTVPPTYIDRLATTYLRPEDASHPEPTLYDHMLRCTLIGAVRRAMEPGCKHDTSCILAGAQEARKSSFWSCLGGPFFSDSLGDLSNKDDLLKLHRSWLMEWAELDAITSRRHAGLIKAFLTQAIDTFRVPYGKAVEPNPRRGIIVGSTNSTEGLLQDSTGNRRFWIIPTTRHLTAPIDTAALALERDAIWAAAVHAYRAGESSHLPVELSIQVNTENESYLVTSPWREPIEAWLAAPANWGKTVTTELILLEAIQKPIERQTRSDQMQVSNLLRELGHQKRRQLVDGRLRWTYHPIAG